MRTVPPSGRVRGPHPHLAAVCRGQAEQLYDLQVGSLSVCQHPAIMQYPHPVVEAVQTVVVHSICSTAMLHEGLGDYLRCGRGQCIHKQKLKGVKFCTSLILNLFYQYLETNHTHSLWSEEICRFRSSVACRRQSLSFSML